MRRIKADAEQLLAKMSADFQKFYSHTGRPSISPDTILKAVILIALHSVRSDQQFCEQLDYNILYRWFLDMSMDEASFDHSCLSKLRSRFKDDTVARMFFSNVVELADQRGLLSKDHFTVDGTLIEAWASPKSFRPKDDSGNKPDDRGDRNFRGEKRINDSHASTTDPEAKMMRKGPEKKPN